MSRRRIYIGIDLGTSNCCAFITSVKGGEKEVYAPIFFRGNDGHSVEQLPSVVYFDENGETFCGWEALEKSNTPIRSFKRLMGVKYTDAKNFVDIKAQFQTILPDDDALSIYVIDPKEGKCKKTPQELTQILLQYLYDCILRAARGKYGEDIYDLDFVCISVPSTCRQRTAYMVREAARRAGFRGVTIISEPIAAAYAYISNENKQPVLMIYDWGGGTFDATILKKEGEHFITLGKHGLENCGGDNIDYALLCALMRKHEEINDWAPNKRVELLNEIRKMKEHGLEELDVMFEKKRYTLGKKVVRDIYNIFISKTVKVCKELVDAVKRKNKDITDVKNIVLVGGSSLLPGIRDMLGKKLDSKGTDDDEYANIPINIPNSTLDDILKNEDDKYDDDDDSDDKSDLTIQIIGDGQLSKDLGETYWKEKKSKAEQVDRANCINSLDYIKQVYVVGLGACKACFDIKHYIRVSDTFYLDSLDDFYKNDDNMEGRMNYVQNGLGWRNSNVVPEKKYFIGRKVPKIPDCTSGRIYVTLNQTEITLLEAFYQIDELGPVIRIPIRQSYDIFESKGVGEREERGRWMCRISLPEKFQNKDDEQQQLPGDGTIYTRLHISQNRDLTMYFSLTPDEDGEWMRGLAS